MTLPPSYFESLYATDDDPWAFRSRWYEERKRALTLAALPRARYARAFEPGCSNGELTALLGVRCDELIAMDVSAVAVDAAASRNRQIPGVQVRRGAIPGDWPRGSFDLIVISELAYYLDADTLAVVDHLAGASLAPGGTFLTCHWRHPVADYPLLGDDVQSVLGSGLCHVGGWTDADFRLDIFSDRSSSVAAAGGLPGAGITA